MHKPASRVRKRTERQLARQAQVFELYVSGKTLIKIARELGIGSLHTVIADIRAESELRAAENAKTRESDTALQLARLDNLYNEATGRFDLQGTSALPTAAKVLEMRAKLLGLDAPTKVEVGIQTLLNALEPPEGK